MDLLPTRLPLAEIAGYDDRSVAIIAGIILGAVVLLWLLLKIWKLLVGIVILIVIAVAGKLFFYWAGTWF